MDLLESYYGKQTFLLYSLFAKVPGAKTCPRIIFLTFSITVLFLVTMFQMIKLVVEKFKRAIVIELLATTATIGGTLLYIPYVAYATEKEYKVLLSIMVNDLRAERTEEEDAIKREYAKSARMFIKTYTIIFILAMCSMPLSGFAPYFLDLLLPLNESREIELFIKGEIFIDQGKYFYQLYFVESCVVFVVGIVIGVSENMAVIIGQHACSMGAVLGHRLESITRIEDRKLLDKSDYKLLVTKKLNGCIVDHQKLLQFGLLIAAFYNVPLTFIIVGTISVLIVSLVQVTDPELINMRIFFFTVAQVFQLFLLSYMGQSGTDASKQISVNAYNVDWHICPPNIRKLLQMVILRSSKPCMVVASSMYTLTLANFLSVMQSVTSCYMVVKQTQ